MRGAARCSVVALALFALCAPSPAPAQPLFSASQDPLAGARVFGAKGCAKCHAVNGVGGRVGPDLGRVPRPRSLYDLATAMWNHLPRMADRMRQLGIARPRMGASEAGDLVAFLFTLSYFDPPGDVEAGRRLFTTKRCVACHQVGGTGGVVGPNLDALGRYGSPILVAAAMWNHGPAMAEAMRARGIVRPTFEATELVNLIAFLGSAAPAPAEEPLYVLPGRPDEGRRLFVERRCIQCHGARGQGGGDAPELADRGRDRSLTQFAAAMWNKAPAMTDAMRARGVPVPQLRAEEMADLVAYLYAIRYFGEPGDPRRGRELAAAKGCLGCHSLAGKGGKVAGDLARSRGLESPAGVVAALWTHTAVMAQEPERLPKGARTSWPELRVQEMTDLVAFLRGLRRTP